MRDVTPGKQPNRYDIQDWLEEWADQCEAAGADPNLTAVLRDDNWGKDLARHILVKVRGAWPQ